MVVAVVDCFLGWFGPRDEGKCMETNGASSIFHDFADKQKLILLNFRILYGTSNVICVDRERERGET